MPIGPRALEWANKEKAWKCDWSLKRLLCVAYVPKKTLQDINPVLMELPLFPLGDVRNEKRGKGNLRKSTHNISLLTYAQRGICTIFQFQSIICASLRVERIKYIETTILLSTMESPKTLRFWILIKRENSPRVWATV